MFDRLGKYISIVRLVISLTPLVIEAIKTVEDAFPSKTGSDKLETVRVMLQGAYASLNEFTVTFEEVWPTIEALISQIVSVFNKLGIFEKDKK